MYMHNYIHIGVPEQALGWLPLHVGLGLVVEDEPFELFMSTYLSIVWV